MEKQPTLRLTQLASSERYSTSIAGNEDFFPMRLRNLRDFGRFVRERGFEFQDEQIGQLWSLVLLEADAVRTVEPVQHQGLHEARVDLQGHVYADLRTPEHRATAGLRDCHPSAQEAPEGRKARGRT